MSTFSKVIRRQCKHNPRAVTLEMLKAATEKGSAIHTQCSICGLALELRPRPKEETGK